VLVEVSRPLNTGLAAEALSICTGRGTSPEALANVMNEISNQPGRRETGQVVELTFFFFF
jgi:hypothetical protein